MGPRELSVTLSAEAQNTGRWSCVGKLRAARRGGSEHRRKECAAALWAGGRDSPGDCRGLLRDASDQGTAGMTVGEIENARKCICRVERTK